MALQEILAHAVGDDVNMNGSNVVDFIDHETKVTVVLDNGQKYDGDLLVGEDGIWSKLKFGNGEDFNSRNGGWNKNIVQLVKIEKWVVVNFSACCDVRGLVWDLIKCGGMNCKFFYSLFTDKHRKGLITFCFVGFLT